MMAKQDAVLRLVICAMCALMAGAGIVSLADTAVFASSDGEWLLISARDKDDVVAELNRAAARGFRFVSMSWTSHEFGMSGLNCLLQKQEGPARRYHFVGGGTAISPKQLRTEANERAREGYRVLPSTFQYRSMYWFRYGGVPFLIMESSPRTELPEYEAASAMSPDGFIDKLLEHCDEGFRLTAIVAGRSYWMMILGRSTQDGGEDGRTVCDLGRLKIIDALKRKSLRKKLLESASQGYRILAITDHGFRGGSLGGILLEQPRGDDPYEYRVPGIADDVENLLPVFNAAGAEGFRLHWAIAPWWFPILEKAPSSDARYEYRIAAESTPTEMLDAVSAAANEEYRVVLLIDDVGALLERTTRQLE